MSDVPDAALATIGSRVAARLIDVVVIGAPLGALSWLVSDVDIDDRVFDRPGWVFWLNFLAGSLYEVLFIAAKGQTLGKMAMRIRVIGVGSLRPPLMQNAIVRAIPAFASVVPVVGALAVLLYLPALWTPRRQGIHDRLAGTLVISADF